MDDHLGKGRRVKQSVVLNCNEQLKFNPQRKLWNKVEDVLQCQRKEELRYRYTHSLQLGRLLYFA